MSTLAQLKEANRLVEEQNELLSALIDETNLLILHFLYKRGRKNKKQMLTELGLTKDVINQSLNTLNKHGLITFVENEAELSEFSRKRIEHGTISLNFLIGKTIVADPKRIAHALPSSYKIEKCIGRGATSFTFRAKQFGTHRPRTVKVFLPGTVTYDQLDEALVKRADITNDSIPEIIEAGQIELIFPDGNTEIVPCVVLTHINGQAKTFAEFLNSQDNINSMILEQFILSIGGALKCIEDVGLVHGDLHERNILVSPGNTATEAKAFHLIDFIGVPSVMSPELTVPSDLDNFRDHLLRAAIIAAERYPGYSARHLLGDNVFRVLDGLRNNQYKTFGAMLSDFSREATSIPENHFKSPSPEPFEWLRVEWITSPDWLYKLFEPIYSRYETIARFGNTWISGPRGCGKSHYLRILAFHPTVIINAERDQALRQKLNDLKYDFRKAFGILFTCRLGEFKSFTPEAINSEGFDKSTQALLKHILVLKIWNKTLHTINQGLTEISPATGKSLLEISKKINKFRSFLEQRLGTIGILEDQNPLSVFHQCLMICSAHENSSIAVWNHPDKRPTSNLLTEYDLDMFFKVLREIVPILKDAKFYILVDDASYGHIDFGMQKILNVLIRSAQANHCFKLTCDKFMYTLETSDDRAIDPRQEVTYVDLGEISTKVQRETPVNLSEYMARVINSRLKAREFTSDIQSLLGASPKSSELLSALSRKKKSSGKTKEYQHKAYYGGWNIIWNLSHGSIRTLLEIVEYIFKSNEVTFHTKHIALKDQHRAIKEFSTRQFRALAMLPGVIEEEPLGQRLKAVINAIGEMSREYLKKYNTGEQNRWYETISIERTDREKLDPTSKETLLKALEYGLLMDDGLTFSRGQFGLCQRYDLNKIFVPAFETTYRVRNHMYLNKERFTQLLIKPDMFIRHNRNKLEELIKRKQLQQKRLFEDDEN